MKFWAIAVFIILFIVSSLFIFIDNKTTTIKVGLLYSKTGTMVNEERAIANMVRYRVEQINDKGGLLNRKIQIIEYDGKSDPKEFKKGAKELISKGVKTIFGCWTSASRKIVKPIVEKNNALLFYPVQYEGVEVSKNIIYLGLTPNQQVKPTLNFIKKNFGKDIYIVGSDYIYPRMIDLYIEKISKIIGMDVVGKNYSLLGNDDFVEIVRDIKRTNPKAIINTINGKSNISFFSELKKQNILANDIPVFSMSIDESSLKEITGKLGKNSLDGHYATWSYFNDQNNNKNKKLTDELAKRFGSDFVLTDAGYSSYIAVKFWERAVTTSKQTDPVYLMKYLKRDSMDTLMGIIYLDPFTNHTHKNISISYIKDDHFKKQYSSNVLTTPHPYPVFESNEYWDKKEKELYNSWGNSWQAGSKDQK